MKDVFVNVLAALSGFLGTPSGLWLYAEDWGCCYPGGVYLLADSAVDDDGGMLYLHWY
jgi:hypothetical protein